MARSEIVEPVDQGERSGERERPEICSTRRRIPWRIEPPVFIARPVGPEPANLVPSAMEGRRVLICSAPETAGQVLRASEPHALSVYAEGRYPTVTAGNGHTVGYAAQWFGEGDYTPDEARTAWEWVQQSIRREWRDDSATLLGTPATTGRDLWLRSLGDEAWPVMAPEAQHAVRASAGQGRMETFRRDGATLRELHEYDARMAYVALMDDLPIGDPEPMGREAAQWASEHPYGEGRYLVQWRAPRGWKHPGLLPAHGDNAAEWVWPLESPEPSWCSGVELFTALRAGWPVEVLSGLVWRAKGSPLRTWRTRLLRVLADSEVADELTDRTRPMVRAMVRAILLHAVGSMHGAPHHVNRTGTAAELAAAADPNGIRALRDGRYTWTEPEPAKWPATVHPEWTATIWGRARARLASSHRGKAGFLTVDPSTLVALRTDAIYTSRPTGWEQHDDGRTVGRYRWRAFRYTSAQPWPVNGGDVLRLRGAR